MKIEFGCGETPTKTGFKTCDIRELDGVDYVCAAWDIAEHVDHNSVDEVFSRHFFEHLTFAQGERMLDAWYSILKPGGVCEMMLPNMSFHINQWVNRSDMDHARAGFWGWQRGEFSDTWDVHKSGYDAETLTHLLESKGWVDIKSLKKPTNKHLHFVFRKPL